MRISLCRRRPPQLGHHVGIEQVHHSKSAGRNRDRSTSSKPRISATSGIANSSTKTRPIPVEAPILLDGQQHACAGWPRSVTNTGPVRAAFFARVTS